MRRDAVGKDVDVLIEVHRRLAPMHAIDLADALAQFEPYWLEEPANLKTWRHLRSPLARAAFVVTEAFPRAGFRPIIRARAVASSILTFELRRYPELMYIAAAAETEAIAVSPHNYNSTTMALSATVHASACMPNFIITEYFLPFESSVAPVSKCAQAC